MCLMKSTVRNISFACSFLRRLNFQSLIYILIALLLLKCKMTMTGAFITSLKMTNFLTTTCTLWVKKGWSATLPITLTNAGQFSKVFHCCIKIKISYKLIIHFPPHLKRVPTIPCITRECYFCYRTSTTNSSVCDFNTRRRHIYLFKLLVAMATISWVCIMKVQNIDKLKQRLIHVWNNLEQSVIDVAMHATDKWCLRVRACVHANILCNCNRKRTENRYSVW